MDPLFAFSNVPVDRRAAPVKWLRGICLLALAIAGVSCHKDHKIDANPQDGERVQLPLILSYDFFNNRVTPSITIYLNGLPVQVVFDTGSAGLKIFKGAVSAATFRDDHARVSAGFGDMINDLHLRGKLAEGTFKIGTLQSALPVRFMLIDSVQNTQGNWVPTGNAITINSGHFRGLPAVFGVGFRNLNDGIGSPIVQLPGSGQFIVHFPGCGGDSGYVIINPDADDLKGFTKMNKLNSWPYALLNGTPGWHDDQVPGSLVIAGQKFTAPTLLDTGNPLSWTDSSFFKVNLHLVGADTVVRMIVGDPVLADTSFTVSGQPLSGRDLVETNMLSPAKNSFGAQFFFDYDVWFDQKNGTIGIKKKAN